MAAVLEGLERQYTAACGKRDRLFAERAQLDEIAAAQRLCVQLQLRIAPLRRARRRAEHPNPGALQAHDDALDGNLSAQVEKLSGMLARGANIGDNNGDGGDSGLARGRAPPTGRGERAAAAARGKPKAKPKAKPTAKPKPPPKPRRGSGGASAMPAATREPTAATREPAAATRERAAAPKQSAGSSARATA